jgi:hypothetical protein
MLKNLLVALSLLLFLAGGVLAQDEMHLMWSDNFEDDDAPAANNVGWLYYSANDGLVGSIVQQKEGELFLQQGSYGGLLGAVIIETNGTPNIFWGNEDSTKSLLIKDNYSNPNQVISFKTRFVRWRDAGAYTSFLSLITRLEMTDSTESLPDADPTTMPGYALVMFPLSKMFIIGKYQGDMAILQPGGEGWTIFAQGAYNFELEVDYRIKFYLKEGDLKVKIWEGEPADEPADWLLEAVDPEPRVTGTFTGFGALGAPPTTADLSDGDQLILDDMEVWGFGPTAVDVEHKTAPSDFQLSQNYPNPFNPETQISFVIPEMTSTKLVIYNTRGQVVRTLIHSNLAAGAHSVTWNGLNENGQSVASGLYIYQLTSGSLTLTKRMVFMK